MKFKDLFTKRGLVKLTLITAVSASLAGCGFHLRGEYPLPDELKTLYISSVDKHGELTRKVKEHLTINHVNLTGPGQGKPELRILRDTLNRRTLSVFENGQVAEYELTYTVRYQLRVDENEPQYFEFALNRDYQDDPNRALAKSRELNLMLGEMRTEAAARILQNLASIQR